MCLMIVPLATKDFTFRYVQNSTAQYALCCGLYGFSVQAALGEF